MSRFLIASILILGSSLAAGCAKKTDSAYDKYLTVSSYEITPIFEPQAAETIVTPVDQCAQAKPLDLDLGGIADQLDKIVAIGEKIWKLVEKGRPVVTFKAPLVSALPAGLPCWSDLERWSPPKSQVWEIAYKNGFGTEVVKFRFRISYTAGGSFEGKGKYLANVTVQPADLQVKWGFDFDAQTVVGRTINLGTKVDPVAGLQLTVSWNVKSWVKENLMTETFFIQGDGLLTKQQ